MTEKQQSAFSKLPLEQQMKAFKRDHSANLSLFKLAKRLLEEYSRLLRVLLPNNDLTIMRPPLEISNQLADIAHDLFLNGNAVQLSYYERAEVEVGLFHSLALLTSQLTEANYVLRDKLEIENRKLRLGASNHT